MATIDDKEYIDSIIAANGDPMKYLSAADVAEIRETGQVEPGVIKIVEYTNMAGRLTWGVVFEGEDLHRYNRATEYVRNPKTIFERED